MEQALQAISHMSVAQKAIAVSAVAAIAILAAAALTAALASWRVALLLWAGVVAALAAFVALRPIGLETLAPSPAPEVDLEAALARLAAEDVRDPTPLNPLCPSFALHHGRRTETAVALLHGISSCPRAFVDLAPALHAAGHNVVALRMPMNGYADRATDALSRLTAEDLRDWGDAAVDIAAGLGDEVVVVGISAGGTVAAWTAVERSEVARAVVVAPFFGLAGVPPWLSPALARTMLVMPNLSMWKDPVLRSRFHGMAHAYARQATRGTGEVLRLAAATFAALDAGPPRGGALALVTNDNDRAVQNALAEDFAARWRSRGAPVVEFRFPASAGLGHEIIDPEEPGADTALTYPLLERMIGAPWSALLAESPAEAHDAATQHDEEAARRRPGG